MPIDVEFAVDATRHRILLDPVDEVVAALRNVVDDGTHIGVADRKAKIHCVGWCFAVHMARGVGLERSGQTCAR